MTPERYNTLCEDLSDLTQEEMDQGWHWCAELDGLLCNCDEEFLPFCRCLGRPGKATERKVIDSPKII